MPAESITQSIIDVLKQKQVLLEGITPEVYSAPNEGPFSSSIGAHVRHSLDHFSSFFSGLDGKRIDYEARKRNEEVAESPELALAIIDKQINQLQAIGTGETGVGLKVREESDSSKAENFNWLESTVGRELQFLLGHTVHHNAIIAILLGHRGVELPGGFGVAPSTRRHEAR